MHRQVDAEIEQIEKQLLILKYLMPMGLHTSETRAAMLEERLELEERLSVLTEPLVRPIHE